MGIELFWDNDEQTILLCEFDKHWTWDEMFSTLNTVKKITDAREDEIGAIIDLSRGLTVPGGSIFNADTREKARQMLKMGEDGKGPIVVAGANGFFRTVHKAFSFIDRDVMNDVYFTDTVEQARTLMTRRLRTGRMIPA
jgi:hypothetical protein